MNYKKVAHSARFPWKMCNFAAQLKHVAYREELVEIQRDNTFRRETLKSSKKARYKSKWQVIIIKHLHFRLLSKNFRKIAMYRLNSLNADIQLIVDAVSASDFFIPTG